MFSPLIAVPNATISCSLAKSLQPAQAVAKYFRSDYYLKITLQLRDNYDSTFSRLAGAVQEMYVQLRGEDAAFAGSVNDDGILLFLGQKGGTPFHVDRTEAWCLAVGLDSEQEVMFPS